MSEIIVDRSFTMLNPKYTPKYDTYTEKYTSANTWRLPYGERPILKTDLIRDYDWGDYTDSWTTLGYRRFYHCPAKQKHYNENRDTECHFSKF